VIAKGIDVDETIEEAKGDAQKMVEALIKEAETSVAKEILNDLEEYNYGGRYYEVSLEYIEQLREKYIKGVE
jgi:hypothetical protein